MEWTDKHRESSSFKDADGHVFYANGKVYREMSPSFIDQYNRLKSDGVYDLAVANGYLFPFQEEIIEQKIYLVSERITTITYSYEWGFNQLKDAAIFHLYFLIFCLKHNCIIKDASPFNIQFVNGRPVFIDVLSLEPYVENMPWNAYKQFCESFLSPLLLSGYFSGNWNRQLIIDIEGIPLYKTASLLPLKAYFNGAAFFHIFLQAKFSGTKGDKKQVTFPKKKIVSIANHLLISIKELAPAQSKSNWSNYSEELPYTLEETALKKTTILKWLNRLNAPIILDVGANHQLFTKDLICASRDLVLIDNDSVVVDEVYKSSKGKNVSVLQVDITNPTPAIGLDLKERKSFFERVKPDVTLALAVVHHLFHTRNIPLHRIAELFSTCSPCLMIELVGEEDEMYLKIKNPNNKHPYNQTEFERAFGVYFNIEHKAEIKPGKRVLYLMKNKGAP